MKDNDVSAFPNNGAWGNGYPEGGMTLRDYFAAKALPIAWQIFDQGYSPDEGSPENVAACAYQYADAMLQERTS